MLEKLTMVLAVSAFLTFLGFCSCSFWFDWIWLVLLEECGSLVIQLVAVVGFY